MKFTSLFNIKYLGNCIITRKGGQGINFTLLWTNSNPDTAFAAQTLNLSLSKYKAVIIEFQNYTTNGPYSMGQLTPIGIGYVAYIGRRQTAGNQPPTDLNRVCFREYSVTSTGIVFRAGNDDGSSTTQACIPYKIWGVK